ncbi:MAG: YebC/PmpR family DNA-binding transcriptional regulator [Bacteroidia bacterium]
MGRIFEKRKHKIFARAAKMSKTFTKIGKEIHIAVKAGGPNPESNSRLRAIIANAKAANMPKANIEAAINRASSKQDKDMEELAYEGKGPHGVAFVIETATDNPTRTVANIRSYFNKTNGTMLTNGSLDFMFERKGVFRIANTNLNIEELELELIDFGLEELVDDGEGNFIIYVPFSDFGAMQKALEDKNIEILNAELQRIPTTYVDVTEEQEADVNKLIEKLEDDDDVTNIWHNMREN